MRRSLAVLLLAGVAALPPSASAQDPAAGTAPDPSGDDPAAAKDASTPEYLKAVELQRKGKWKEAQKAFRDLVAKYPESVHKDDCEMRGGDNCYMGCVRLLESGPPSRRIDVAVMGDGFTNDAAEQKKEEEWARGYLDPALFSEWAYDEYRSYFNYYYVRLVSKEAGVDQVMSPEEEKKLEEKNKGRGKKLKKQPKEFDTALDCKAAGPQKQVVADRDLVYHWLEYANREVPGCGDDGLVIAFAKFGQLGMGGGGIANVGPPDKSIDVHEFGHAFVGLLDEYTNNPAAPTYPIRAANATSDPKDVPWQHFLDRKVKGVGVYEGGATYVKGVWRPALSCAMNSAGNSGGYCPVCREAAMLVIYSYVDPIDKMSHLPTQEVKCVNGDATELVVTPMQPKSHDLKCEWYVDRIPDSEAGPEKPGDETTSDGSSDISRGGGGWGKRAVGRDGANYEIPPFGQLSELARNEPSTKKAGARFVFPVGKLGRGRFQVTCRVWDPIENVVLKDPQHLLEERESWFVAVAPKK